MLAQVTGRLYLYSKLIANMAAWATKQAVGRLLCKGRHPLNWPAEQDFNIMLLRTLFTSGNYLHWRNFTAIWAKINGKAEQKGLVLERVAPGTFGVPNCRNSWWISLGPELLKDCPPVKASCVLLYLHGGAFLAGDPRMYCPAFRHWMQALAAQGISMQVLSVGYPLAPENTFPSPVLAAAAAYRWLLDQLKAQGRSDTVIIGGDSAGGNLVLASLAYLRDGTLHSPSSPSAAAAAAAQPSQAAPPPPAGALLISPAVDFTSSSIFGPKMAAYFAALRPGQQQAKEPAAGVQVSQLPPTPQPPGSEWDYITVNEGAAVAKYYVRAQSEAEVAQPLVSPARLQSFKGLVQHKVLLVWGGIELMGPDIAAFAGQLRGDGVAVQVHAEANEPHVYPVLPLGGVLHKGAKVVVPFLAACALNEA